MAGHVGEKTGGVFENVGSLAHPKTGQHIHVSQAWSYVATQTTVSQTVWEAVGPDEQIVDRWESGPLRFHCSFPSEMEHLLARTGFEIEDVYGSSLREALTDESSEMVWVARNRRIKDC